MGYGQIALGLLVFLFLLGLFVIGVVCIFNPSWAMKHFGGMQFRAGGQMRQETNRRGFQLFGFVFAVFALYILFQLVHR